MSDLLRECKKCLLMCAPDSACQAPRNSGTLHHLSLGILFSQPFSLLMSALELYSRIIVIFLHNFVAGLKPSLLSPDAFSKVCFWSEDSLLQGVQIILWMCWPGGLHWGTWRCHLFSVCGSFRESRDRTVSLPSHFPLKCSWWSGSVLLDLNMENENGKTMCWGNHLQRFFYTETFWKDFMGMS